MTSLKDAFVTSHRQRSADVAICVEAVTNIHSSLTRIISDYTNALADDVLDVVTNENIAIAIRCWSLRGVSVINCGINRWINNCEFYVSGGNIHYRTVFRPSEPPTDEEILSQVDVRWHEIVKRGIAAVAKKYIEARDPTVCITCF